MTSYILPYSGLFMLVEKLRKNSPIVADFQEILERQKAED